MFSLTQALVTRYAKLSALKNLIDKWLEDKKPLILEALESEACPDKGPYLLERKQVAQGPNYKELLYARLRSDGMNEQEIVLWVVGQNSEKTILRLEKKINPNYRKTFTIKLPA
jgi:hypothetical protein